MSTNREQWSSKFGFIMSSAGAAVEQSDEDTFV